MSSKLPVNGSWVTSNRMVDLEEFDSGIVPGMMGRALQETPTLWEDDGNQGPILYKLGYR